MRGGTGPVAGQAKGILNMSRCIPGLSRMVVFISLKGQKWYNFDLELDGLKTSKLINRLLRLLLFCF